VGVGLQPAVAALLVLAQLSLAIVGPVDLLGGHRQPTRHPGRLVIAAAQPAKHAGRLVTGGLLVGGQDFLGLLAVGRGPDEFPAAAAGCQRISGLRALAGPGTDVGAYLRLDRGWPAGERTDRRLQEYLTSGMSELHLYHLGLLGQQGLATLRAVIDKTRALASRA
jgi:hypothetical protein